MNKGSQTLHQRVALLDTTIQVDRGKTGSRRDRIESLLGEFDFTISTSISLLEFKATVVQECITIHNELRSRRRFTLPRDRLLESKHRQVSLRAHIFNNLIAIGASSLEIGEPEDRRLAEQARLLLENVIPRLCEWFVHESVDGILRDRIACTRAEEPPTKKRAAFAANLPECRRGSNKRCHVEDFIRDVGPRFASDLGRLLSEVGEDERSEQLVRSLKVLESVCDDHRRELSRSDCRRAGDCLIALEAKDRATHALSTNTREWQLLSDLLGFDLVRVDYPDERTR